MLDFILIIPIGALLWATSIGTLHFIAAKGVTTLADDLRPTYRSR